MIPSATAIGSHDDTNGIKTADRSKLDEVVEQDRDDVDRGEDDGQRTEEAVQGEQPRG